MSITYTFTDLTNAGQRVLPRSVESDAAAFICNIAMNEIWQKYDWRESLVTLPPFYLIPNEQDHGAPAVAVPADFLGLRQAYLVHLLATPVYRQPMTPLKDLGLTTSYGLPGQIGYQADKAAFRVFPRVPMNIGAPDWCIQGVYKNRPTKLTAANMSSTLLPFDDLYFSNMLAVYKWAGYVMAGDQRAGGIQTNKQGNSVYTGAYAEAHDAIDRMAMTEGVELGDVNIAPSEALAITSMNTGFGPFARNWGW